MIKLRVIEGKLNSALDYIWDILGGNVDNYVVVLHEKLGYTLDEIRGELHCGCGFRSEKVNEIMKRNFGSNE